MVFVLGSNVACRSMGLVFIENFILFILFYIFKILFIHERHRERQKHKQREKQAPCKEPEAGFDPQTPGSHPELKADAQLLSHPGIPTYTYLSNLWTQCGA